MTEFVNNITYAATSNPDGLGGLILIIAGVLIPVIIIGKDKRS